MSLYPTNPTHNLGCYTQALAHENLHARIISQTRVYGLFLLIIYAHLVNYFEKCHVVESVKILEAFTLLNIMLHNT
jgi:hypothetical protein